MSTSCSASPLKPQAVRPPFDPTEDRSFDVAIVGAGVMGASTAFWLKQHAPRLRIALIERDFSFREASSSLSASSIRQQFTCPVNIELSRFGIEFLRSVAEHLSCSGEPLDLGLTERGYLYLANEGQAVGLRQAQAIQKQHGAQLELLSPSELKRRFPWLNTDGIALGSLGVSGEGWFDGPGLHQAFLRKALSLGVVRLPGEVREVVCTGNSSSQRSVRSLMLADGREIACDMLVCAAGAWSGTLVTEIDIRLPITAAQRTVFVLSCPEPLPGCPLLIDPSGFWLRPEGRFLLAGMPAPEASELEPLSFGKAASGHLTPELGLDPDYGALDEAGWALLAHRIPPLEAMRIERAWAGYYEMNRFDQNAVIGPFSGFDNFYCIAGFSGHGMQHAPGAGLALAEWILFGVPRTIDVRPLGHGRITRNQALREFNVIG